MERVRATRQRPRRVLDERLFRDSPPTPPLSKRRFAVGLAIALAGVLVVLLRLALVPPLDSIWAEDGSIFLDAALNDGFVDAVTTNYAGYLHLVPRLLAEPVASLPLEWAAASLSLLGAAGVVLCAFVVWWASAGHLEDRRLRALMAAMVVLLPVVGYESLANLAYLWWFMLFATFWVLLWRPPSTAAALAGSAFVALTVMSAPLALVLAPLAFLRVLAARDARDWILVAAFAAAAVVQSAAILLGEPAGEAGGSGWSWALLPAYLLRVVGGAVFGQYPDAALWLVIGPPILLLFGGIFAAIVAAAMRGTGARPLCLIAIALSVAFFLLGGYQRDLADTLMWSVGDATTAGARHTITPALLLIAVILVQLQHRPRSASPRLWGQLRRGALSAIFVVVAISFYVGNSYRWTPRWSAELEAARERCAAGEDAAVILPIAPPPWGVEAPCSRLT